MDFIHLYALNLHLHLGDTSLIEILSASVTQISKLDKHVKR